ncbi:hypothetical protein UlMin_031338 [Ulmus minor]
MLSQYSTSLRDFTSFTSLNTPYQSTYAYIVELYALTIFYKLKRFYILCVNPEKIRISNLVLNVAIIKSSKDNRYAIDSVVTHDGVKFPCSVLQDLLSFRQKFGEDAYEKLDVIGIDEAQFFDDLYDFCCKAADLDGKTIILAGLDGDYLRRSFGSVLDVIPLADTVTKLIAHCELCGKRAFFTLRKSRDTRTELIGGFDLYMPVCHQHYVNGQVAIEVAFNVIESHKIKREIYIETVSASVV